jgi:surface antigen
VREYAPMYDGDNKSWSVIARDPYDYAGGTHWFVYARLTNTDKDKATELADALNYTQKRETTEL